YILAMRASLRKIIRKEAGDPVIVKLEEDVDFKVEIPEDLEICLLDEPKLFESFMELAKSHRNYFINYINEAKTETTRTKRIVMTIEAMEKGFDYGQMIRNSRGQF
ncbi:MAG: hypothetical protein EOO97_00495, partial [Pedobacter sp.]